MQQAINPIYIAEAYQPLFNMMQQEHNLILTVGEMDDIISAVSKVEENLTELYRNVCDVNGCNNTASSGGVNWKEQGYWSTCPKHSQDAREGESMPPMKNEAIAREASRLPNGILMYQA